MSVSFVDDVMTAASFNRIACATVALLSFAGGFILGFAVAIT